MSMSYDIILVMGFEYIGVRSPCDVTNQS